MQRDWTDIAVETPSDIFAALVGHLEAEEQPIRRLSANTASLERNGMTVRIQYSATRLEIHLEAPTEAGLCVLREGTVDHIAELDAGAAASIRWRASLGPQGAHQQPPNFQVGRLMRVERILHDLSRLHVEVPDPTAFATGGLHVKLALPPSGRDPVWPSLAANGTAAWPSGQDALAIRYYTIRHVAEASVQIDVVRHGAGVVSGWCDGAAIGEPIGVMGPGGDALPAGDGSVFVAGDMTALPAIARMIEDERGARAYRVFVASSDPSAEAYVGGTVTVLRPETFHDDIQDILRRETIPDVAWFAGEFATAQAVRRVFRDVWALPRARQLSTAYWRRGWVRDAGPRSAT